MSENNQQEKTIQELQIQNINDVAAPQEAAPEKRVTSVWLADHKKQIIIAAIYFALYGMGFYFIEQMEVESYFIVHTALDDMLPFCEIFIIPYVLWFVYLAGGVVLFLFLDKKEFWQMFVMLATGMTLFLVVSALFPNMQPLRPSELPRANFCTAIVAWLYATDTPTNVLPSIHVYDSLVINYAILAAAEFKGKKWLRRGSNILCYLIVVATMLVKQHSVIDVTTGALLFIALYLVVYKVKWNHRKRVRDNLYLGMAALILAALVAVLAWSVAVYQSQTGSLQQSYLIDGNGDTVAAVGVSDDAEDPDALDEDAQDPEAAGELDEATLAAIAEETTAYLQEVANGVRNRILAGFTFAEALRPYYPGYIVLYAGSEVAFVPIDYSLKLNNYQQDNLVILENGEYEYYENGELISHKGIDVSKFQGEIDWEAVAADGVEFAFIRVGYRGYGEEGKLVEDPTYQQYIEGAIAAGIPVGVYFYSQAITEAEALEEANFVLELIADYDLSCPVVYDVEKVGGYDGRMNSLSVEDRTAYTIVFCEAIKAAGYDVMIYENTEMGASMLDVTQLEDYEKWFADYSGELYFPYAYSILQYSDTATVDGVPELVDLNISFSAFWEE